MYDGVVMNRKNVEQHLIELTSGDGKRNGDFQIKRLSREIADQLRNVYAGITDAKIYQYDALSTEIMQDLSSYASGETDYDAMVESMTSRINLYINE